MRFWLLFFSALSLAACASISPTDLLKSQNVDFSKADLSAVRFAALLSAEAGIRAGSARLVVLARSGSGSMLQTTFRLEPTKGDDMKDARLASGEIGTSHVFRLAPADLPRAENFRREAIARMSGQPHLEFGLSADLCVKTQTSRRLTVSVYVKTAESAGFIAIDKDRDIAVLLSEGRVPAALPSCQGGVVSRRDDERKG